MLDEYAGLFYIGHNIIDLTRLENKCLQVFIKYKHRVVTYENLLKYIYKETEINNNTRNKMKILVYRTYKKIEKYFKLKRIRNKGYFLEERENGIRI